MKRVQTKQTKRTKTHNVKKETQTHDRAVWHDSDKANKRNKTIQCEKGSTKNLTEQYSTDSEKANNRNKTIQCEKGNTKSSQINMKRILTKQTKGTKPRRDNMKWFRQSEQTEQNHKIWKRTHKIMTEQYERIETVQANGTRPYNMKKEIQKHDRTR